MVDPMKRVTIPEIRQHNWFQAHLPRYLAVPPPDTVQQAKKVNLTYLLSFSSEIVYIPLFQNSLQGLVSFVD